MCATVGVRVVFNLYQMSSFSFYICHFCAVSNEAETPSLKKNNNNNNVKYIQGDLSRLWHFGAELSSELFDIVTVSVRFIAKT